MPVTAWALIKKGTNITAWANQQPVGVVAPLIIQNASLPQGEMGVAYGPVLVTVNKIGSVAWSVTGAPPGVTINPLTGVMSGTPTAAGSFQTKVRAVLAGETVEKTFTVVIEADDTSLIAVPATLTLRLSDGPQEVTITDNGGALLSGDKALSAKATVTKPGYAVPSKSFISGRLIVTPVAIGSGVITVTYGDQIDDEKTVQIPVTVVP